MDARALTGQIAFITGGGSGLGAEFARRLHRDGATIVVNDIDPDAAALVATEVGGVAKPFDVTESAEFDTAVDDTVGEFGGIDILINNAGIAPPFDRDRFERTVANEMLRMQGLLAEMSPIEQLSSLSDDDWDRMIRIHLHGTFYGTRAALRHMQPRRQGIIVNISSVLGLRPSASAPHYSAAKAGIIALTRATAEEVAPFGIRANAVCPGWTDTPLLEPFDADARSLIATRVPMGRLGRPEEIAELVRFLCGPESSYCNGEVHAAGGGYA